MNLKEAALLLNRIVEVCPELDGNTFQMMVPEMPPPPTSEGYEVIIRNKSEIVNEEVIDKLKIIAEEKRLILQQMKTSIMIYTPKHVNRVVS